jgi:hypothetical protein
MKKGISVVIAIVFVLVLVLASTPKTVQAFKPIDNVAGGSWTSGTETIIDTTAFPGPNQWQLLTNGVVLTAPTRLCHPFRGGQFGWTAEILELKDGTWVKLPTTEGWVPDTEGAFMACANAPEAGTYALFGYYTVPARSCAEITKDWYADYFYAPSYPELYPGLSGWYLDAYVPGIPLGSKVTYEILTPDSNLSADSTGTTHSYLYNGSSRWADFVESSPLEWEGPWEITVKISGGGCSIIDTVSSGSD